MEPCTDRVGTNVNENAETEKDRYKREFIISKLNYTLTTYVIFKINIPSNSGSSHYLKLKSKILFNK